MILPASPPQSLVIQPPHCRLSCELRVRDRSVLRVRVDPGGSPWSWTVQYQYGDGESHDLLDLAQSDRAAWLVQQRGPFPAGVLERLRKHDIIVMVGDRD
jgi:hypothetical protein